MKKSLSVLRRTFILAVTVLGVPVFAKDTCERSAQTQAPHSFVRYLEGPLVQLWEYQLVQGASVRTHSTPLSHDIPYSKASINFLSGVRFFGADKARLDSQEVLVAGDWLKPQTTPRQVSSAIRISHSDEDTLDTGCCKAADGGHWETLFPPVIDAQNESLLAGKTTLVYVKGLGLVGAVKRVGDPTMIALKDVVDRDGYFVLIKGGIYNIEKAVFQNQLKPLFTSELRFPSIQIHSLLVRPGRFFDVSEIEIGTAAENLSSSDLHRRQWARFLELADRVVTHFEGQ